MSEFNADTRPKLDDNELPLLRKICKILYDLFTNGLSVNMNASDIQIGAVEVKDGGTDTRAKVASAASGAARTDAALVVADPMSAPAGSAFAVTPHNSNALSATTRAVYVGGAGNMVAVIGGTEVTFVGIPAGTLLPIQATIIKATNTTATSIIGLY